MRPHSIVDAHSRAIPVLLICVGVFLIAINAAAAKWLVDRYTPLQILFARSVLAFPLVAVATYWFGGERAFKSHRVSVHVIRGLLTVAAILAYVESLDHLALADATALIFTAPIFVTLLSVPLLKEKLTAARIIAISAGFIGGIIIIRPNDISYQPATLFALAAALLNACMLLSSRWIDGRDSFWTLMFYVALFPLILSSQAIFTVWPTLIFLDAALFCGIAICGTLAPALVSQAFRMAPASSISPFDYSALIWVILLGWVFWGEYPGLWTCVGAAVIVASGILLVFTEKGQGA